MNAAGLQTRRSLWMRPSSRVPTVCCAVFAGVLAFGASDAHAQGRSVPTFNMVPITITSVTPQGGQLVATGVAGSTPFTVPLTLNAGAIPENGVCPILDLSLGPIHLNLLGLHVDTSPICLEITAIPSGGLLGDLLCAIANLLNAQIPLATILEGLTAEELSTLDAGLTNVLNQVFVMLTSSQAVVGGSCDILNLAIGPLELTLLGLVVRLDDCAGGPVTLDVTAVPSGGLLGDLLCNLNRLLARPDQGLANRLRQIARAIGRLIG